WRRWRPPTTERWRQPGQLRLFALSLVGAAICMAVLDCRLRVVAAMLTFGAPGGARRRAISHLRRASPGWRVLLFAHVCLPVFSRRHAHNGSMMADVE